MSIIEAPRKPLRPSSPSPRKPTLLLVDDEDGPRQALQIVFMDDYNILLAANGARAIEMVKIYRVDAAVVDIRMPGMSGIELLHHIKEIEPSIEVVMLTAYETLDTARQALRLGACDYLTKPFDVATIKAAVSSAMERRSITEEIFANNQKLLRIQEEIDQQRLREEIARTRGEIYASVIHDINSPLTVISGFVEIITDNVSHSSCLEGADLEQIKSHLDQVTRQVNKCIEISRRYLSFLQQRPAEAPKVGVNQVFSDLSELLRAHPSARGHHFYAQAMPEEELAAINGTDLIQILLNLSVNAFQSSSQPHSVSISCRRLQEELDLEQFADGPQECFLNRDAFANTPPLLAISVNDNGGGIPPEVLAKMFEPYFTTKTDSQGTGLGLVIVHRFVKEARGAIHVKTAVGQGTTFTLYLPALPKASWKAGR